MFSANLQGFQSSILRAFKFIATVMVSYTALHMVKTSCTSVNPFL